MVRSRQRVTRDAPAGREFAVAAARRESVDAAVAMLEAGGNAVDAAVACGFVAGVVEPSDTCLAGSGLMIVSDPAGADLAIEFPPRAPAAARPDMYEVVSSAGATKLLGVSVVAGDANADGILAPGVPGTIAGLLAAHERLGRLDREQVMAPAIRAAADGFEVDAYFALQAREALDALRAQPEAAALYLVDGLPPRPAFLGGTTLAVPPRLRQPELARTLEIVAGQGAAGFYGGEVAAAIEHHFAERGGLLTRADLASYAPLVGEPLRVRYRDCELLVPRSPCGGWTAAQMLRVLERFAPRAATEQSPEELHVLAGASAYAFADRYAWLGDPDAVPVPLGGLLSDGLCGRDRGADPRGRAGPRPRSDRRAAVGGAGVPGAGRSVAARPAARPPGRVGACGAGDGRARHARDDPLRGDRPRRDDGLLHPHRGQRVRLEGRGRGHRRALRRVDGVVQRRAGCRELDRARPAAAGEHVPARADVRTDGRGWRSAPRAGAGSRAPSSRS